MFAYTPSKSRWCNSMQFRKEFWGTTRKFERAVLFLDVDPRLKSKQVKVSVFALNMALSTILPDFSILNWTWIVDTENEDLQTIVFFQLWLCDLPLIIDTFTIRHISFYAKKFTVTIPTSWIDGGLQQTSNTNLHLDVKSLKPQMFKKGRTSEVAPSWGGWTTGVNTWEKWPHTVIRLEEIKPVWSDIVKFIFKRHFVFYMNFDSVKSIEPKQKFSGIFGAGKLFLKNDKNHRSFRSVMKPWNGLLRVKKQLWLKIILKKTLGSQKGPLKNTPQKMDAFIVSFPLVSPFDLFEPWLESIHLKRTSCWGLSEYSPSTPWLCHKCSVPYRASIAMLDSWGGG